MSPGKIRTKTVAELSGLIHRMRLGIVDLPLESEGAFLQDLHKVAAGESYLRRALEALFDVCRHILAKGFGIAAPEYAATAREMQRLGLLDEELAGRLRKMARYRNRMVHFYDEITPEELYGILTRHLTDIEAVLDTLRRWLQDHPEVSDTTL